MKCIPLESDEKIHATAMHKTTKTRIALKNTESVIPTVRLTHTVNYIKKKKTSRLFLI